MAERDRSGHGWIRYGLPGLAFGLILAWFLGGREPSALAQNTPPGGPKGSQPATDGSGLIAFTVPGSGTGQLLYLVDTKSRAFAVYTIDPRNAKGVVKLEAARQYQWDLKLSEYNNQEPGPAAIESTVKKPESTEPIDATRTCSLVVSGCQTED